MTEKTEQEIEEIVASAQVKEMLTAAGAFCRFVEDELTTTDVPTAKWRLQVYLTMLYLKGLTLPSLDTTEDIQTNFVTEEALEVLHVRLAKFFENENYFTATGEAIDSPNMPQVLSISECIRNIYEDLKNVLLIWERPLFTSKQNAVSFCKYTFFNGWGVVCMMLMPYLHDGMTE